jgi:hypothetical protein
MVAALTSMAAPALNVSNCPDQVHTVVYAHACGHCCLMDGCELCNVEVLYPLTVPEQAATSWLQDTCPFPCFLSWTKVRHVQSFKRAPTQHPENIVNFH